MATLEEIAINPFPARRWQSFALWALWLGFVTYAVMLSPSSTPDTFDTIWQLSTGQWAELNPVIVVLFNLMGLWPMVYASLALPDGREQRFPAWPFVVGSFGLGAFALMPYLALRKPTKDIPNHSNDTIATHRLVGAGVTITTLALLVYGLSRGSWYENWQIFISEFSTSQFIHVMSLDFCMLTLLTPSLLWDDVARRHLAPGWRLVSLVPLLGPALYLLLRPTDAVARG